LKYRPGFPDRFGCLEDARGFCQSFFRWYNFEHHHSGLGLMTPAVVHVGKATDLLVQRQAGLDTAFQTHPERFVRQPPTPPSLPSAVWINKPPDKEKTP
jgi:putative transposase